MIRALIPLAILALAACGESPPAGSPAANEAAPTANSAVPTPVPDTVKVRLETEAGNIVLQLDGRHAPITTANFLAYVDQHRFDGITFYRASRTPRTPGRGFIQGGIRRAAMLALPPIAHEPTSRTGLHHVDGTISMARLEPGSAMGDWVILSGAEPSMDAGHRRPSSGNNDTEGYAAFGHVVEGMDVVRRILAAPTVENAGAGAMRGQMLVQPVRIVRAVRAD
ncbi:peptidylprolyl isomerase [Allosphingosinicella sp.]|uniref:peptidylprolyl isomerase n=1 Tax=Allosphingosinicella sp. TaxID=2823234 RepID=UPI003784CA22